MKRTARIAVVATIAVLSLAACGDDSDTTAGNGGESPAADASICDDATGDGPKIGVAYDVGGRGDLSFNDSAYEGLEQAVDEFDATCTEAEAGTNESEADREERLRQLADAGFNPVLAIGFVYSPSVYKVAQEYPDVDFAVVDGYVTFANPDGEMQPVENATDLNFAGEQGSFLVGVAAALKSEAKTVGFLGGVNGPLIQSFEAGFKAGVKAADPKVKVLTTYLSQADPVQGFENRSGGQTAANGLYDDGADIVYHAAGKSGLGLFDAVAERGDGFWAIGVDSDQYLTADDAAKPHILTSMLKRVNVGIYDYLKAFDEGAVEGGITNYDLAGDGVGYSTSGGFIDDIKPQIDEYAQKIIDGEIKVPTTP